MQAKSLLKHFQDVRLFNVKPDVSIVIYRDDDQSPFWCSFLEQPTPVFELPVGFVPAGMAITDNDAIILVDKNGNSLNLMRHIGLLIASWDCLL